MTFLFLDKVAGIVGAPEDLLDATRERIFREPVRHEGLRRLSRPDVAVHVASVVAGVANARLRGPFVEAVELHAAEATDLHELVHGPDDEGLRDAVLAAFAGNDVGLDLAALPAGEATPEAAADQILTVPEGAALDALMARLGVTAADVDAIVDEILKVGEELWSLARLAEAILQSAERGIGCCAASGGMHLDAVEEALRYVLCETDLSLRATGLHMLDLGVTDETLNAWLDERAMFSTPASDEADVAEVLRHVAMLNDPDNPEITEEQITNMRPAREVLPHLFNEEGGGSHSRQHVDPAADKTAAGAEHDQAAPAAELPKSQPPIATPESDLTRAVQGALKALFELTKETDTHVAEVLGVPKAVVAQARKGVTPWAPSTAQCLTLKALVNDYRAGLALALSALDKETDDAGE